MQGYKATSLSDITTATELTKGAIYRHFGSKEGLEREALVFMCDHMMSTVSALVKAEHTAPDKLLRSWIFTLHIPSIHRFTGVPVNECLHRNGRFRLRPTRCGGRSNTKTAWRRAAYRSQVIEHGQLAPRVDPSSFASLLVASVEGAIGMMKVTGATKHLRDVISLLKQQVDQMKPSGETRFLHFLSPLRTGPEGTPSRFPEHRRPQSGPRFSEQNSEDLPLGNRSKKDSFLHGWQSNSFHWKRFIEQFDHAEYTESPSMHRPTAHRKERS
ncbi:MAG: TetR/AcrR family transcriptional regulator [Flavobacteriales bacterium]|nr:TetR/AcrR family transcriptional regulator [Flavobacteriales bacterium]